MLLYVVLMLILFHGGISLTHHSSLLVNTLDSAACQLAMPESNQYNKYIALSAASHTNRLGIYQCIPWMMLHALLALIMSTNSGLREAPPTRKPSTSFCEPGRISAYHCTER